MNKLTFQALSTILLYIVLIVPVNAQNTVDHVVNLYNAESYDVAIIVAEKMLKQELSVEDNIKVNVVLANCDFYKRNFKSAKASYEKVIKLSDFTESVKEGAVPEYILYYIKSLKSLGYYALAAEKVNYHYSHPSLKYTKESLLSGIDFAKDNIELSQDGINQITPQTQINTAYSEFAPIIIDKDVVYYASFERPESIPKLDIQAHLNYTYAASISEEGDFENATYLHLARYKSNVIADPSPPMNEFPLAISKSLNIALSSPRFYLNNYCHACFELADNFYVNVFNLDDKMQWDDNQNKRFKIQGKDYSISFPYFSEDGYTLFFASKSISEGYGGFDLYKSTYNLDTKEWSKPINLGPRVNSAADEVSPCMKDGALYFSSNKNEGLGGMDIFRSLNKDNNWSEAINLVSINSPYDDMYYIVSDNKTAYFSSNRIGGKGGYDIYKFELPISLADNEASSNDVGFARSINKESTKFGFTGAKAIKKTKVSTPKPTQSTKPTKTIRKREIFVGSVIDAIKNEPLNDVRIEYYNPETLKRKKIYSNGFGEYSVKLELGQHYYFTLSKVKYKTENFSVFVKKGRKTILANKKMSLEIDPSENIVNKDKDAVENTLVATARSIETANSTKLSDKTDLSNYDSKIKYLKSSQGYMNFETRSSKTYPAICYVIQIGVVVKPLTNVELEKLQYYGNIISKQKGKRLIYQLGIFADKTHLNETLAQVKANTKFKDAFIKQKKVASVGIDDIEHLEQELMIIYPKTEKQETATRSIVNAIDNKDKPSNIKLGSAVGSHNNKPKEYSANTASSPKTTNKTIEYGVQLGVFSNLNNFNRSFYKKFDGVLKEEQHKSSLIVVYLTGYSSEEKARSVHKKLKEEGVDAMVVAFKDNQKVSLSSLR